MSWLVTAAVVGAGLGYAGTKAGKGKKGGIEKTSTLNPEQEKIMKELTGFTEGRIGEGLPEWQGDWTVPQTPDERWGLGKYRETVEGLSPDKVSDWYMKYIAPSEQRYLKNVSIPSFKESMVPGGALRSTGTESGIADIISKYGEGQLGRIGGAIMSERQRSLSALPGYMQAAGMSRFIEQEDLNRRIEEFKRTAPELSPILELAMNIMNTQTQAAYWRPRKPNAMEVLLPSLIQAGGAVAGGYAGKPSAPTPTK